MADVSMSNPITDFRVYVCAIKASTPLLVPTSKTKSDFLIFINFAK